MAGRKFNPGSRKNITTAVFEKKAMEMRMQGMSYEAIGAKLGYSSNATHAAVMRVLKFHDEDVKEKVPQARQLELDRCDKMLDALWPKVKAGDTYAIGAALKVAERRARLSGLDMPVKVDPLSGEGGAIALELFRQMVASGGERPE